MPGKITTFLIQLLLMASALTLNGCKSAPATQPVTNASREALQSDEWKKTLIDGPAEQVNDKPNADAKGLQQSYLPDLAPQSTPNYRIGAGDRISVIYRFTNEPIGGAYHVGTADVLKISFSETPAYDRVVKVGPDGHVLLPLIGDLDVGGKTVPEIYKALKDKYASYLEQPAMDVQLQEVRTPTEELRNAMANSTHGQSVSMLVRPDGFITLPILGDVRALGLTVAELGQQVATAYNQKGIGGVEANVILEETGSSVAYVMGEVPTPGAVPLRVATDVWRVIALAGGFSAQADRRHIVVAKSGAEGEKRYVVDFDRWRRESDSGNNVQINPGDMIYIPRSNSQFAYLTGELKQPGRIVLDEDTYLTVSQAIGVAGGVTTRGTRKQVLLLRPRRGQEPIILSVNLDSIFEPGRYNGEFKEQPWDPRVQPGDTIFAPSTFVGDLNRFAEQWFKDGIWTIIPFNASAQYTYSKGNFTSQSTQ